MVAIGITAPNAEEMADGSVHTQMQHTMTPLILQVQIQPTDIVTLQNLMTIPVIDPGPPPETSLQTNNVLKAD